MVSTFERAEVDLRVDPTTSMTDVCIQALADLLKILWMEEDEAYNQTMPLNLQHHNIMTRLYNAAGMYSMYLVRLELAELTVVER